MSYSIGELAKIVGMSVHGENEGLVTPTRQKSDLFRRRQEIDWIFNSYERNRNVNKRYEKIHWIKTIRRTTSRGADATFTSKKDTRTVEYL